MPDWPEWLVQSDDGLYGDQDAFIELYKTGAMWESYGRQVACNALSDPAKVKAWLWSESYQDRQQGIVGGISGCTLGQDNEDN